VADGGKERDVIDFFDFIYRIRDMCSQEMDLRRGFYDSDGQCIDAPEYLPSGSMQSVKRTDGGFFQATRWCDRPRH
jgi:hypothetical protein